MTEVTTEELIDELNLIAEYAGIEHFVFSGQVLREGVSELQINDDRRYPVRTSVCLNLVKRLPDRVTAAGMVASLYLAAPR